MLIKPVRRYIKRQVERDLFDVVVAQAGFDGVSSGLIAFGTAAAVVPDFIPAEVKLPIAVTAWLSGVIGFSIKEALGGRGPAAST